MPSQEYLKMHGWNASKLKMLLVSYNAFLASEQRTRQPTKSMLTGTLVDAMLLGGENALDAAIEDIGHSKKIDPIIDDALIIAAKAMRNPAVAEMVEMCDKHTVLQWCRDQGPFKARKAELDLIRIDGDTAWLYDVKTTCGGVSPAECGRESYKFDYDLQLAWYLDGLLALYPQIVNVYKGILFISTSAQQDYDAAKINVTDRFIDVGKGKIVTAEIMYEQGLARTKLGEFCGGWPGENDIQGYNY